jgi:hypothetical protein
MGTAMNDADLFILSRAQIIALVQASAGPECESDDYINFIMNEKYKPLPEKSIAILYYGSSGEIMMRSIKKDD